jgi:hypothetical protein
MEIEELRAQVDPMLGPVSILGERPRSEPEKNSPDYCRNLRATDEG